MALKPGRNPLHDSIEYFGYEVMERGGVVVANTTASGVSGEGLDNANRRVQYADDSSGRIPIGLLLWDTVNIDLSRQQMNHYKNEVQIGNKVPLALKGSFVTNMIGAGEASGSITLPTTAYVGTSGKLYSSSGYGTLHDVSGIVIGGSGWPVVGKFLTTIDSDGYAEVYIDLP